eukprot:Pompholyxophrys_punicea_v1_NODE_1144_length_912_cov_2.774796.p1 type:complete len:200 gc:universal NODE_1144_length_912_cov_2.774796:701-102(-)
MGLNAANSENFCLWCLCTKSQISNMDTVWKISRDTKKTLEAFKNGWPLPPGQIRLPIFSLPHCRYILDILHLFLRISDTLMKAAIDEMISFLPNSKDEEEMLLKFILEARRCRVKIEFWRQETSNTLSWTSLMGEDKFLILKNFNLEIIMPSSRAAQTRKIWDEFLDLHSILNNGNPSATEIKGTFFFPSSFYLLKFQS